MATSLQKDKVAARNGAANDMAVVQRRAPHRVAPFKNLAHMATGLQRDIMAAISEAAN